MENPSILVTKTPSPFIPSSSQISAETTLLTNLLTSTLKTNPTPTSTFAPTSTTTPAPPSPTSTVPSSKIFYVSTNGDDSNLGTESQPWKTIQKAADTAASGDLVLVLPGEYDERVQISISGTSGAPITYQAEGTATMKGFTVRADHIIINGFDITDTDNHWSEGWGIFVQGSHCVLENNYVYFATRGGILLFDTATSNCRVQNNRLYRNAMTGIYVQGRDHLIVGNEIWRTIQYHPNWTNPPSSVDADGIRFFGSGHTIRKNYIHDIRLDDPENVDPHIDCFQTWGGTNYEAGHDIIFEQNYCENLNEGMYAFMLKDAKNLMIRNNIIIAFGGVNTGGGGNRNLTIVNNVFASDLSFPPIGAVGIRLENCPDTVIMNNIFYDIPNKAISVDRASEAGLAVGYNCIYHSDGSDPNGSPYPNDLWQVDPQFVDPAAADFHLQQVSLLIDAGEALIIVVKDYENVPRPQGGGYDIGAYEHPAR